MTISKLATCAAALVLLAAASAQAQKRQAGGQVHGRAAPSQNRAGVVTGTPR